MGNNQLSKVISMVEIQAVLIKVLALSLSVKIIYLSVFWYFHLHSENPKNPYFTLRVLKELDSMNACRPH